MAGSEFLLSLGLWFVRAFVSSLICLLIGYVGIRSITLLTTKIKEFESIKGHLSLLVFLWAAFSSMLAWSSTGQWLIRSSFRNQ